MGWQEGIGGIRWVSGNAFEFCHAEAEEVEDEVCEEELEGVAAPFGDEEAGEGDDAGGARVD